MTTKIHHTFEIAALLLLPTTAACGQAHPQPAQGSLKVTPPRAGLSLQTFTARREQRMLTADVDRNGKVSRAEFLASATSGESDADGVLPRPERSAARKKTDVSNS